MVASETAAMGVIGRAATKIFRISKRSVTGPDRSARAMTRFTRHDSGRGVPGRRRRWWVGMDGAFGEDRRSRVGNRFGAKGKATGR